LLPESTRVPAASASRDLDPRSAKSPAKTHAPQQIGPDLYLIAVYPRPGGLYEFTREGRIVFSYSFPSGDQMLDHPSLVERLPNGLVCVNDDYRHRVVIIDPTTKQIVWQYGHTDILGTTPGLLNTPDGFDLLAPNHTTPTHPQTG